MTMERNGGAVNGWTVNPQLTVKLSVFSPLQSLINQSSGSCGTASRRCPSLARVEVRKHRLLSCCGGLLPFSKKPLLRLLQEIPLGEAEQAGGGKSQ
jgi:hypothetical protein